VAANPPGTPGADLATLSVGIDIKPASINNVVSLRPRGLSTVPVAILGGESFDVLWVDVGTVVFGPGSAEPMHDVPRACARCDHHFNDVDGDGFIDLVLHFRVHEAFDQGDVTLTEACIAGWTLDEEGIPNDARAVSFAGCDAVRIIAA
jgi:hypothetical protein